MTRIILVLLTALFFSAPSWGQESQSAEPGTADPESAEAAKQETADQDSGETAASEEDPLAGLDEPGYDDEDEDDFVPTEEIPYDQDIPFPTDI